MEDLARWLGEQFDADERIARATDDTLGQRQLTWSVEPVDDAFSKVLAGGQYVVGTGEFTPEDAAHIAAWGPARVLRDIEARRRTLVRCQEEMLSGIPRLVHFAKQTVREMALPYQDASGYAEALASYE